MECLGLGLCSVQGTRLGEPKLVFLAMKAYHYLTKDCMGYLANVVVSSTSTLRVLTQISSLRSYLEYRHTKGLSL